MAHKSVSRTWRELSLSFVSLEASGSMGRTHGAPDVKTGGSSAPENTSAKTRFVMPFRGLATSSTVLVASARRGVATPAGDYRTGGSAPNLAHASGLMTSCHFVCSSLSITGVFRLACRISVVPTSSCKHTAIEALRERGKHETPRGKT